MMLFHHLEDVGEGIRGEGAVKALARSCGSLGGAGEHEGFETPDGPVQIGVVGEGIDDGKGKVCTVAQREVGTIAGEGRHEMGGVADKREAGAVRPAVADGQLIKRASCHVIVGLGKEGLQCGSPGGKKFGQVPLRGRWNGVKCAGVKSGVHVQATGAGGMADDGLTVRCREHAPSADELFELG